jgi:hypothetical protein
MASMRIPDVLREVVAELGGMPGRGLLLFGALAAFNAGAALLTWTHRPMVTPFDFALTAAGVIAWLAIAYWVAMSMVEHSPSWRGLGKFVATTMALALPPIIGVLAVVTSHRFHNGALAALGAGLVLMGLIGCMLLVAWPLLEATSSRLVGPLRAFQMTRGLRWQLVFMAILPGAFARGLADMTTTSDFWTAALMASINAVAAMCGPVFALAVAVTAFKFGVRTWAPGAR